MFASNLKPPTFSSYAALGSYLAHNLEKNDMITVAYSFLQKPDQLALNKLALCHKENNIKVRIPSGLFPQDVKKIVVGGKDWGVEITLVELSSFNWALESMNLR